MAISPPRSPNRESARSSYWAKRWPQFVMPTIVIAVLIQIVFLADLSYLYGSFFESGERNKAIKILAIDYDGGDIGSSLNMAYSNLEANTFPTLHFRPASDYPTPESVKQAMCKEGYWGVVYSHSGASDRLMAAISGKSEDKYNPEDTISYTHFGSYYPVVEMSVVTSSLQTLISVSSRMFYQVSKSASTAVNLTQPGSASAFLNPIQASSVIESPTNQGSRVLLNTVTLVMAPLMQFFFLMGSINVARDATVFSKMSKRDYFVIRFVISRVYTLICALTTTGYIWAFREDWFVNGGHFGKTWMAFWLYMEIHHLVVDTLLESVIPLKFFSFFLITWILTNITSSIYPFELSPGFYRIGYALPAHNIWMLLMAIWSNGCKQQLHISLPVLFSWLVVGHVGSAWSMTKRCAVAEAAAAAAEAGTQVTQSLPIEKRVDSDSSDQTV